MDLFAFLVDFLTGQIIGNVVIFYGLIVFFGNLLRRLPLGENLASTIKEIAGTMILFAGVNMLLTAVAPITSFMSVALGGVTGVLPLDFIPFSNVMEHYGSAVGIAVLIGVFVNLVLARITKFKVIHITGHLVIMFTSFFVGSAIGNGIDVTTSIILGGVIAGIYNWGICAGSYYFMSKNDRLTDTFAFGGSEVSTVTLTALISPMIGNREESTEDIKYPKSLTFLKDPMLSAAILFTLLTFFFGVWAGEGTVAEFAAGQNWLLFLLLTGATYASSFWILLYGVRMLVGELLPSFEGLERILPGAKPGLDYPMMVQFAPTGAFLGSILFQIGQVVATAVQVALGFAIVVLPSQCSGWFIGLALGAVGNAYGGRRAAIILNLLVGFLISFVWVVYFPLTGNIFTVTNAIYDYTDAILYIPWLLFVRMLGGAG